MLLLKSNSDDELPRICKRGLNSLVGAGVLGTLRPILSAAAFSLATSDGKVFSLEQTPSSSLLPVASFMSTSGLRSSAAPVPEVGTSVFCCTS
uniref:Uncharacterized protein LOC105642502 n=1 Tax=Rhizophora mucronata TaxID=61149 RepID=A0A2P2MTS2_RHIMU